MTRVQLTDEEWGFVGPYLPIGEYGPYPERLRQQFEGMIWWFKTGGQRREMPQEFGAWSTVSNCFRQWRDAGVFEALLEGLIAEPEKRGEVDLSLVSVDSVTAHAHHDAAGMHPDQDVITALEKAAAEEKARSKEAVSKSKTDRARDRSRAGRATTQLASAKAAAEGRPAGTLQGRTDQQGPHRRRPQVPAAGVRPDCGPGRGQPAVHPRAGKIRVRGPVGRTRPDVVTGDKAYSSRGIGAHLRRRGIKAVIPEKRDQAAHRRRRGSGGGRPVSHDADLYKERNTVERLINKLKAWRGIATRYDKTPNSYLAGLHLRASMIWLKDLTRVTQ